MGGDRAGRAGGGTRGRAGEWMRAWEGQWRSDGELGKGKREGESWGRVGEG